MNADAYRASKRKRDRGPTIGSLFAGIGGFDLGFERAGWRTAWQVEICPVCNLVLADRFPHAKRYEDIRRFRPGPDDRVDCITAGFPCTDISTMGSSGGGPRSGLRGERSGLFFEIIRILDAIRPPWVVLENVPQLLSVNGGRDLETIIRSLADRGYLGLFRVLDAQGFGVPQRRRRLFVVARLGSPPPLELLADAAPVETIPGTAFQERQPAAEVAWASYTLTGSNSACRLGLGCEVLVAEEGLWDQMAERERVSRLHGLPKGLDGWNLAQRMCAGNAVCPAVAEWIATKMIRVHIGKRRSTAADEERM